MVLLSQALVAVADLLQSVSYCIAALLQLRSLPLQPLSFLAVLCQLFLPFFQFLHRIDLYLQSALLLRVCLLLQALVFPCQFLISRGGEGQPEGLILFWLCCMSGKVLVEGSCMRYLFWKGEKLDLRSA